MNDQVSMNDAAARSPTGEILDQTPTTTTPDSPTPISTPIAAPATPDAPTPETPTPKDAPTTTPAVPETYAPFAAPDNYTIDPSALAAATPVFKELGLTQDQAQKLVDIQVQREIALAKAPQDAVETMRKEWRGKVESDPEIKATVDKNSGKTGLAAVKVNIARTLSALPVDLQVDFKEAMDRTGAGDHPAFVKALNRLASFVTEGSHVAGAGPSAGGQTKPGASARPTAAEAMYPTLPRGS